MGLPPTIQAASIGIPDTMLLMLLALVVFGPRRLPEIGRQIGKLMYELRKVSNDFKFQMEEELRAVEEAERQRKLQAAVAAPATLELNIPPHPVSETALETSHPYTAPEPEFISSGTASENVETTSDHSEPRKFPPVMPPSTGEVVEAARPFRGRVPDPVQTPADAIIEEAATESGADPSEIASPDTHPGTEHESNHA